LPTAARRTDRVVRHVKYLFEETRTQLANPDVELRRAALRRPYPDGSSRSRRRYRASAAPAPCSQLKSDPIGARRKLRLGYVKVPLHREAIDEAVRNSGIEVRFAN